MSGLAGAIALDVCLNGARDYVQGTQMIARAAEIAARDRGPVTLAAAAFHRITDRTVALAPAEAAAEDDEAPLGTLVFTRPDGTRADYRLLAEAAAAPRRAISVEPSWREIDGARQGPLSTAFALSGLGDGEDFLVSVVQTIKGLHEALAADVHDVWLTGLRGASVPMAAPFPVADGTLTLACRRMMPGRDSRQSLLMADMAGPDGGRVAAAAVTFSFRTEATIHVD